MAKDLTPKGSIIYKLLILILAVALVLTILYPNRLWEEEKAHTLECHSNMEHILYAELTFLSENNAYCDTLSKVIDFIKDDSTGKRIRTFVTSDSVLAVNVFNYFKTTGDSFAMAIVDTLREYGRQHDLDTTAALVMDSLRLANSSYGMKIDSIALATLDQITFCPTTGEEYKIFVNNDSTFKKITIQCPLDSLDMLQVKKDFVKSTLGGLELKNHGSIDENGEKSWLKK